MLLSAAQMGCGEQAKSNKKWKLLWATSFLLRLAQVKKKTVQGCRQGETLLISQQMMAQCNMVQHFKKDVFELERAQLEGVQKTRENKESSRKHGLKGNIEQIWILQLKAEEGEEVLNFRRL